LPLLAPGSFSRRLVLAARDLVRNPGPKRKDSLGEVLQNSAELFVHHAPSSSLPTSCACLAWSSCSGSRASGGRHRADPDDQEPPPNASIEGGEHSLRRPSGSAEAAPHIRRRHTAEKTTSPSRMHMEEPPLPKAPDRRCPSSLSRSVSGEADTSRLPDRPKTWTPPKWFMPHGVDVRPPYGGLAFRRLSLSAPPALRAAP